MPWERYEHRFSGKYSNRILVDRHLGKLRKTVGMLYDYCGSFNELPTAEDFQREVGWGLHLLNDPRWQLSDMIPQSEVLLENDDDSATGFTCWIEMDYIRGTPLENIEHVPLSVMNQLAVFCSRSAKMAEW